MKIGTRSILFGGHQFLLHPLCVALAWRRLYGAWPRSLPLWLAIVCHDWGYFGCPDTDGFRGQRHPARGALLVHRLCDAPGERAWFDFTAGHSRTYARLVGIPTSRLMEADKLATALMPYWLYIGLLALSGEWREYVALDQAHGYDGPPTLLAWARHLRAEWRAHYGTAA